MLASCRASSTRAGRWGGTCRSSARPRSAPARPRTCWRSPNIGRRSTPTISALYATPPAASCRSTVDFLGRVKSAKIDMGATLLWWIALGYDSPRLIAQAMKAVGTEPKQVVGYLNKLKGFPGVYGDISFTAEQHNGYPDDEIVMVEANSLKDGAFNLAPGYSA